METSQCFMSWNLGSRRIVFDCGATYLQHDADLLQSDGASALLKSGGEAIR